MSSPDEKLLLYAVAEGFDDVEGSVAFCIGFTNALRILRTHPEWAVTFDRLTKSPIKPENVEGIVKAIPLEAQS